jgi:hypothetical protein
MEYTPDLDRVIDGRVHGAERDLFQRVHDVLVRAGPLPELPARWRGHPPSPCGDWRRPSGALTDRQSDGTGLAYLDRTPVRRRGTR